MTGPHWREILSPPEQDGVRTLAAAAERADGVAPLGEQVLRDLAGARSEARTEHRLVHDAAGALVGYLTIAPGDSGATAELVVHPDARRRGMGTELLSAAVQRCGRGLRVWAHGTLPAARALAATVGLRPVRELVQMRRPLEDLPKSESPQGISLRSYGGSADHAELLRVNNAAFAWHPEQGGWTETEIAERLAAPWFEPDGLFLAYDDSTGALCGFHWTKVHDEKLGEVLGEVYVLGVDPQAQGRGLGRALILHGLEHLATRLPGPQTAVMLYVESDNAAAIKTYEALGFAQFSVDTAYAPV
ncbi:mycothiol synthase [Mycolicibacterium sp.]|uniref:mycothiol synthase n=1 Tax=Mycolicibacterium sp. TaxID=2320850 RepID=UPI0028ADFBB8|nr:mycothiol synthase [Mycolicibacterium sp.]